MNEAISDSGTSEYFDEVLVLLREYQWIYNYPNIELLVSSNFNQIPKDWLNFQKNLTYNDLKDLVQGNCKEESPEPLKNFCKKVKDLSKSQCEESISVVDYKLENSSKLNTKKQHEIVYLAPVIAEICALTGSYEVVDIGAGLGYLSYLLAEQYNFSICAIEGCNQKIDLALNVQQKYHKTTREKVIFHHHFITENSLDIIEKMLRTQFSNSKNLCVCGLHACADLSIVILDLFLKVNEMKSLVIMPCCYHRLKLAKTINGSEYFSSFPISKLLIKKFEEFKAAGFLRRPFLRLACQQTKSSFISMSEEEHKNHATNFLMRAILEKGAHEVDCDISRLKRKTGRKLKENSSFEDYLENLSQTYKLNPKNQTSDGINIEDAKFRKKLLELWGNHKDYVFLMEMMTALQTSLQSICENILLLDRVQFLRENGVNCYIRKVTDDNISPRCYALVAIKQ